MKKIFSVLLCLVFILGLGGAGVTSVYAAADTENAAISEGGGTAAPQGLVVGEVADAYMEHGGINRLYHYYIPSSYKAGQKLPLMFTLHGSGFNGLFQLLSDSKFQEVAEREGFIVIAPNAVAISADGTLSCEGYGSSELGVDASNVRWNAGSYDPIAAYGVDDVGYLCALIDYFDGQGVVDTNRVFASGLSHGACMSIRLALEAPERFAGIAPVSGLLFTEYVDHTPSATMKMVYIHGDADPVIPIEGMVYPGIDFAQSLDATIAWFANHYGISGQPEVSALEPVDANDPTRVVRYDYGANGAASIVKYVIEGGGHTWPGGTQYMPPAYIGRLSNQISASEVIWQELKIDVTATASASVAKLSGNQNELAITITKSYDTGLVADVTKTFTIANNAAGTYEVEGYSVYVDTKGNTQVRECTIVA